MKMLLDNATVTDNYLTKGNMNPMLWLNYVDKNNISAFTDM